MSGERREMEPVTVDVRGLSVRYRRRTALEGVSLALRPGVHGLLGPNGAGKTTLMRVLATLVEPDSGEVELLGHSGSDAQGRAEIRRALGYLPQTFGYYPRFTVREFVEYFAWLKQIPPVQIPGAVELALARVGLVSRAADRLKTLSGGMLRRVGIAQAIVNRPKLLLLDEPTAGLDPEQRVAFRALVTDLAADSTVVLSTHLAEDVATTCDDVVIMAEGRLAFRGTTRDLITLGQDRDGGAADSTIERGYSAALALHRSGDL